MADYDPEMMLTNPGRTISNYRLSDTEGQRDMGVGGDLGQWNMPV